MFWFPSQNGNRFFFDRGGLLLVGYLRFFDVFLWHILYPRAYVCACTCVRAVARDPETDDSLVNVSVAKTNSKEN